MLHAFAVFGARDSRVIPDLEQRSIEQQPIAISVVPAIRPVMRRDFHVAQF